jgi:cytidylate kinase
MGTVTISASYGAGGSIVAPAVAERLNLPFVDRAIPVAVAEKLAVPLEQALAHDERIPGGLGRLLAMAIRLPALNGATVPLPAEAFDTAQDYKMHTEAIIRGIADATGGVILGRGAQIILRARADALHVRLDGPLEARLRQAARLEHIDIEEAKRQQRQVDRARDAAFHQFYGRPQTDSSLYHLIVDSTALPLPACIGLIVAAANARAGLVRAS